MKLSQGGDLEVYCDFITRVPCLFVCCAVFVRVAFKE